MSQQIAVVGAGLLGRMVAWQKLQENCQVTLFEQTQKDSRSSAGLTAAAMLAPYTEATQTEPLVRDIGIESIRIWPKIIKTLEEKTKKSVYYSMKGTLVIAHPQDDADWNAFNNMAMQRLGQNVLSILNESAVHDMEPELSDRFKQASFFEHEGVLCNEQLFEALAVGLETNNLVWIENTTVSALDQIVKSQDYDWIYDCRGMGAQATTPSLRGVRGEVIRVYAPDVNISRPVRLTHPRFPLYIAPHGDHQYVIGATQIESESMHPVTVRSGLELLSALYSIHPGFAEAHILRMEANCRPAFNNNLPRIQINQNIISVNGLYRHGYLFAPALLRDIEHYLNNNPEKMQFPQLFECEGKPFSQS